MSTLSVLEDAILWQGGELPDELCPLYLVAKGRELGGDAAAVAEVALREHREAWFGGYDVKAILERLRSSRGKEKLARLEVLRAIWFHVESERQIVAEWGPDALVVLSDAEFQEQDMPRGQTNWGHLRTLAKPTSGRLGGAFRIQGAPGDCRWVGDKKEARRMTGILQSSVSSPVGMGCGPLGGWHRGDYGRLFRHLTEPQRSRKARDAARASRQAEAEMVVGVGR